jgi:hypothetical protein
MSVDWQGPGWVSGERGVAEGDVPGGVDVVGYCLLKCTAVGKVICEEAYHASGLSAGSKRSDG